MRSNRRVVGTGLIALDILIDQRGEAVSSALGGSAGNVLSILASLGWGATPISVIGKDHAGERLLQEFRLVNANTSYLKQSKHFRTPVVYQHQLSGNDGPTHRFSFTCPQCGTKHKPNFCIDERVIDGKVRSAPDADVFFLDRPTRLGYKLAERYSQKGVFIVFEPSAVGDDPELFERILKYTNVLKYADDRIPDLDVFDLSKVDIEIQTKGADGLKFRASSLTKDWVSMGAYKLPTIKDTSGAGDWCTAGFIHSLLHRTSLQKGITYTCIAHALAYGQVLSTFNCMTVGARGLLSEYSTKNITTAATRLTKSRFSEMSELQDYLSGVVYQEGLYDYLYTKRSRKYRPSPDLSVLQSFECCGS
ncbi:PfkB family carbohydrate kinase [Spartinivicinus poritis]|uniref:PfkB family carbohydrate kinase n=1 Tax=Spartinivicinus poritis TaxID=2994640 RepID=A0ABT5UEI0_9GAMM|nr:PfkB family carbohydrate kinase [Spartinivicinus sp. A2-2]MDE1464768.1 PfkB family carbohydrate kinase [Spartinivicinus sp. A2-2]